VKNKTVKIKDRTAGIQSKNLNIRVSPYLYMMLEDMARNNNLTVSDIVRSTLNERLMQGRKFRREN